MEKLDTAIELVHVAITMTSRICVSVKRVCSARREGNCNGYSERKIALAVLSAAGQHGKGKIPGEATDTWQYRRPLRSEWRLRNKCRVVRLAERRVS